MVVLCCIRKFKLHQLFLPSYEDSEDGVLGRWQLIVSSKTASTMFCHLPRNVQLIVSSPIFHSLNPTLPTFVFLHKSFINE